MDSTLVYLSLGGNEGNVLPRLHKVLEFLEAEPGIANLQCSHFYQTAPCEMDSSHWFVNAVCSFQTTLTLKDLFIYTQFIEVKLGKVAKPKDADRPIDIDLLFYGDMTYQGANLEIPHPRWKERLFVLFPLADLTSEIIIQGSNGKKCYLIQQLIDLVLAQSAQCIYLLEKNPDLKYYRSP